MLLFSLCWHAHCGRPGLKSLGSLDLGTCAWRWMCRCANVDSRSSKAVRVETDDPPGAPPPYRGCCGVAIYRPSLLRSSPDRGRCPDVCQTTNPCPEPRRYSVKKVPAAHSDLAERLVSTLLGGTTIQSGVAEVLDMLAFAPLLFLFGILHGLCTGYNIGT